MSSFNPLTTNILHHIETSQLIKLTGFYMMGKMVTSELSGDQYQLLFENLVWPVALLKMTPL